MTASKHPHIPSSPAPGLGPKAVKGVLFDFDGTLVNSYPLIEEAFAEVMHAHRLDERARELFRRSRGLPLPEQMKRISPQMWEELVETYRKADARLPHAGAFDGVPELVDRLSSAGIRLAVVSCKRHALVESELEAVGLRNYFELVIGYEDVSPPKPAPDPLLFAMERLGLAAPLTLYAGDSLVDLETGRAAGVRTVLAAWGLSPEFKASFNGHRPRAESPQELIDLVLPSAPPDGRPRAA